MHKTYRIYIDNKIHKQLTRNPINNNNQKIVTSQRLPLEDCPTQFKHNYTKTITGTIKNVHNAKIKVL